MGNSAKMVDVFSDEGFILMDGAGGNENIRIGQEFAGGAQGTADSASLNGFGQMDGDEVESGEKRKLACEVGVGKPLKVFHSGDGGDAHRPTRVLFEKAVAWAGLPLFPLPLEVDQEGGIKMHGVNPMGRARP